MLENAPPYTQTDLMTQNAADPRAMPLKDYLAETMEILAPTKSRSWWRAPRYDATPSARTRSV